MNQNRNAVLAIAALVGLAVAIEYYFVLHVEPRESSWYQTVLSFFVKAGWLLRVLFAVLTTVLFMYADEGKSYWQARRRKKLPLRQQLALLTGFLLSAGLLAGVHRFPGLFPWLLPAAVTMVAGFGAAVGYWILRQGPPNPLPEDRKKGVSAKGFQFRTTTGAWVKMPKLFRGVLIVAGPGGGKTYTWAKPFIRQSMEQDFCGILYDIKFPELTEYAYHYRKLNPKASAKFCILNMHDMNRTHRLNPIAVEYLPSISHAEEYAIALVKNLQPENIDKPDFWSRSSTAVVTSIIWYLRKHHPLQCTLPHVVTLLTKIPYSRMMTLLSRDAECLSYVMSVVTAMDNKAADQLSGVMGTLQVVVAKLATPEIFWVMSATDPGFSMNLNKKNDPIFLCLGGQRGSEALRPVLGLYCTVALKLMNQEGKHHSIVLLDEAPTIYIPNFEQIPATGRSSQIATVFMCQDFAQIQKYYGEKETRMLLGTLQNQLYGNTTNIDTAKVASQLIGRHEVIVAEETRTKGPHFDLGSLLDHRAASGRSQGSINYRRQEKPIIYPEYMNEFDEGEFVGVTVGTTYGKFWGTLAPEPDEGSIDPLPAFSVQHDLRTNMDNIVLDCADILGLSDDEIGHLLTPFEPVS
ncbi:MAG: Type secretory pathway VirD4 protein-like protein [Spirosoma sp.]|nr:Type secretory pathway VirD4 protein-like protein [Spirosoma sp.]